MNTLDRIKQMLENPPKFGGKLSAREIAIYVMLEGSTDIRSQVAFVTEAGIVKGTWYSTAGSSDYPEFLLINDATVIQNSGVETHFPDLILYLDRIVALSLPKDESGNQG